MTVQFTGMTSAVMGFGDGRHRSRGGGMGGGRGRKVGVFLRRCKQLPFPIPFSVCLFDRVSVHPISCPCTRPCIHSSIHHPPTHPAKQRWETLRDKQTHARVNESKQRSFPPSKQRQATPSNTAKRAGIKGKRGETQTLLLRDTPLRQKRSEGSGLGDLRDREGGTEMEG